MRPIAAAMFSVPSGVQFLPVQAVSFSETLKCIAKVVLALDVSVKHPEPVKHA